MPRRIWACLVALAIASCSSARAPATGRIVVALTMDWEGASLANKELDALDAVRAQLGGAPITHFISAAYFTKPDPDPAVIDTITALVRSGDELALHLHAWRSLAQASGVQPKLSPSFLTGTDKLLQFGGGDVGFDTDLDAYDVVALRAMVRTSRRLLEETHLPVAPTFRAGGYLGTPKVLQAIRDEGFTVDSSATDYRALAIRDVDFLSKRLAGVWPRVTTMTQPYIIRTADGDLLEMPIAAIADYVTPAAIVGVFDAARARLAAAPNRDVFVVLAFHLETAPEFASRVVEAIAEVRARADIAGELIFVTMQAAAARANAALR